MEAGHAITGLELPYLVAYTMDDARDVVARVQFFVEEVGDFPAPRKRNGSAISWVKGGRRANYVKSVGKTECTHTSPWGCSPKPQP
jgi:hypothetical protein